MLLEYHEKADSGLNANPTKQPQDRPLRSKRAHRKGTPPPSGAAGVPQSSPVPPSTSGGAAPAAGAAETPEPSRVLPAPSTEDTPAPASTNGVQLPPLSSALPPSSAPQSAPSGFAAIDNPAPEEADGDTEMGGEDR